MKKALLIVSAFVMSIAAIAANENLALNKKAVASSVQMKNSDAKFAVDGKSGTRWSSSFSDPATLMVDLGSAKNVSRAVIIWEIAAAKEYKVQISNDGKNWKDLVAVKDGKAGRAELKFKSQNGRYVRILGTKRTTKYGYSVFEFEVYEK